MKMPELVCGLLRHIGYAGLSLSLVCIFIEIYLPGFATAYVHPYALSVTSLLVLFLASYLSWPEAHGSSV
jgi:hypothetical protein